MPNFALILTIIINLIYTYELLSQQYFIYLMINLNITCLLLIFLFDNF